MAGFQLKNFTSIVAGMINHVRGTAARLTDFNIGSVVRTVLEAVGIEIEEAYQQGFNGLRAAIPVATYTSFNFGRLPAAPASGLIRVTVAITANNVSIPAGTVFTTPDSRTTFVSQAAVTILAGQSTGDVQVIAAIAGILGNIRANSSFTAQPTIPNFTSATNLKLFSNGRDIESDEEQKQRFVDYVASLQRAVGGALVYGAKQAALFNSDDIEVERVKHATIREPYLEDSGNPIAWVQVYVHNGVGATSGPLVTRAATVLHGYTDAETGEKVAGYKAAGVKVDVAAAAEVQVNIVGYITPAPGYDGAELVASAEDVLARYLLGLNNGVTFQLGGDTGAVVLVSEIEGIANIVFDIVSTNPLYATSVTNITPGTGVKNFTVAASKGFVTGNLLKVRHKTDRTKWMEGVVDSYSGTTLALDVKAFEGAAGADWLIGPVDPDDVACDVDEKLMPGALELLAA